MPAVDALLRTYDVSPERGFLPDPDPLTELPLPYRAWDDLARDLPLLLPTRQLTREIARLPLLDTAALENTPQFERAMLVLSYLAHGFIFTETPPRARLPAQVAVPWVAVAKRLGRPPILTYASHDLHNWRRADAAQPIALDNLIRLARFYGGLDEDWFVLVHVAIEAAAGPGIYALVQAQEAVPHGRVDDIASHLNSAADAVETMLAILQRMPQGCDPYIYYTRVRAFMFGWKDNPGLPDGLVYEGVNEFVGKPQQFIGETGAQSSVVPFFDAALGIEGSPDDPLARFVRALRDYMPVRHRRFIEEVGARADVRGFVLGHRLGQPALVEAYNRCVRMLGAFRQLHLEYAATYIHAQAQKHASNSTAVGTGGTDFMRYLKRHLDDANARLIA